MKEEKYIYKVFDNYRKEATDEEFNLEKELNKQNTSKRFIDVIYKEYQTIVIWED
jgi:hypothetical protein